MLLTASQGILISTLSVSPDIISVFESLFPPLKCTGMPGQDKEARSIPTGGQITALRSHIVKKTVAVVLEQKINC